MISACKHFPELRNKQAVSVLTAQLLCGGLPQAGSGAPPQALFLVPPTASSGTSAPCALPQVPWPEFLPLSGVGGGGWFPRVTSGCVPGGVEKDYVGGCVGAPGRLVGAGWELGDVRDREFHCPLLCPPMEVLKTFEAGGRGGGGKGDCQNACLSVLISCVSSALRKIKQSNRDSGFDEN